MKKLSSSIATAGAALIALGTLATTPATAGTIKFNYTAEVSGAAFLESQFASQVETALGLSPGELPTGNFTLNEFFSGAFTSSDDPQLYLDGAIEVNLGLLSEASGLPFNNLSPLLNQNNVSLSGSGTLTSSLGTLPFDLSFNNPNQSIQVTFNPSQANLIGACLEGECTAEATGVNATVTSKANNTTVASLTNVSFSVTTTPTKPAKIPETSTWLGLIGIGGLLVANRKRLKAN
jgi:hypothetical protein